MSKYVVVDLEMCNVPRGVKRDQFKWKNELIQIGAVLLDESLEITDTFMTYVSPEFGVMDTYIENLTGISRANIKNAPCTKSALESFISWLPDDAVLVSWSENDENQIRKELDGKSLEIDGLNKYLDNWVDCQKTFGKKMNAEKNYKLSEALIIADIDLEDGEHDALVDARNTAYLFAKMEREPELKLNPYYTSTDTNETSMYNPFAELLANYKFAV